MVSLGWALGFLGVIFAGAVGEALLERWLGVSDDIEIVVRERRARGEVRR